MIAGLNVETVDVLAIPPSVSIFGIPGTGKTTEMARAFQNALYIQSSGSILHAYAHWAKLHPELNLKIPARITFDENYIKANGGSPTACLVNIVSRYLAACDAGKSPYEGIIFDEWNVICERVWTEMKTDPWGIFKGRSGKFNIFAAMDYFRDLHRKVLSIQRRTRKMLGFVSHAQMPKFDEDENSITKGQLKWRGGPGMPQGLSGSMMELCADADVVLQLEWKSAKKKEFSLDLTPAAVTPAPLAQVVTPASNPLTLDLGASAAVATPVNTVIAPTLAQVVASTSPATQDSQRVFLTELDDRWYRKFRGFGILPEEPLDIHSGKGLRELLRRGGYPV